MKKLFVLSAVTLACCAAQAQSSVTLFGVVEETRDQTKAGDAKAPEVNGGGLSTSRLGFRGAEDLGGGLSAGFWLEASVAGDSGATNTQRFFHRRSTVSLSSASWGEIRLGRDN